MNTRNSVDNVIKSITGLNQVESDALQDHGILSQDDLNYVEFEDLPDVITIVKRRKLSLLGKYLTLGGPALTVNTNMREVLKFTVEKSTMTGITGSTLAESLGGGPKVQTNPLKTFSGDPIDYEDWVNESLATLRQTVYKPFMDRTADVNKPNEVARNAELYNIILSAVLKGHACNIVEKLKDDPNIGESGFEAWKALKEWYMDPSQKTTMIEYYSNKLDSLELDRDTTATEFVNKFDSYVRKLEKLENAAWSDEKKVREFKKRVTDEDYDTEKRVHNSNFDDLVKTFRKREQDLDKDAISGKDKLRRFRRNGDDDQRDGNQGGNDSGTGRVTGGKGQSYIPYIPNFLFKSLDKNGRVNVRKWRDLTNAGKTMVKDDLVCIGNGTNGDTKEDESSKATTPSNGKQSNRKGKKQRRLTTTAASGTLDDTVVEVKLDSDVDEYRHCSNLIRNSRVSLNIGHDSNDQMMSGHSKQEVLERKIRRNTSVGMSSGRRIIPPYAVIDPGAEEDLVGGVGWYIRHISDSSQTLNGAIDGMGSITLPRVDAITAVNDSRGNVVLLGVGAVTYDCRLTQYESLLNSHHLREHGTVVNDIARCHKGKQNLEILVDGSYCNIPLKFNGDIMMLNLREPTEEELTMLRVVWILPAMAEHTPQSIRRSRVVLEEHRIRQLGNEDDNLIVPEEEVLVQDSNTPPDLGVKNGDVKSRRNWKELLGFPNDDALEKTLDATTQFCAEPVEMERREIPRQHRKKRLYPLHPRRLTGRVDADTFFSSVKSVRGYKCVQLFVHVKSDYVFARCMQRESHSHGAYQDFIREIGAPQLLVTDNSQTQTGKLWEVTSRKTMIKQRKFAPYNQNQNKAERRIQDAKHKTMLVMYHADAPLDFWCYALLHVIDCMNYTAKKSLGWRTSYELLNGDTPDISAFRFSFWQLIEYFDPTARFPDSQWKKGRFLGIAWDSGDQFTFKVWASSHDCKDGRELIRNIVRPCRVIQEESTSRINEEQDYSHFKFQRLVPSRKRRRGNKHVISYHLADLPEYNHNDSNAEEVDNDVQQRVARSVRFDDHPVVIDNPTHSGNDSDDEEHDDRGEMNTANTIINQLTQPETSTPSNEPGEQESEENIEMVNEINDQFSRPDESPQIGGSKVVGVCAHKWEFGQLYFQVRMSNDETSWESLKDLREDCPRLVAQYIVDNRVSRSKRGSDRTLQWAKKVLRDMHRAIRRITRLYDFFLDDDDSIRKVRRIQSNKGRKKKKPAQHRRQFKYGIEIPRNVEHALKLDEANGNTFWFDSIRKEVDDVIALDCFEFKEAGYNPGGDWQRATLHIVFDVKHDLRRKSRLVAGGHLVDLIDTPVYSSTVKSISVQLLHVIAHKAGLQQLCGDIGNAFPNAYTNEKVYVPRAGKEFGELEGRTIIIKRALYGLRSSAERFHTHLADTFRTFGFKQTRFDSDVWIRLDQKEKMYEYICTHVDDFMIVSKNPDAVMKEIESVYLVKDDSKGPPDYYLGNDYKKDNKGRWCIGCKKYLTEAITRVEAMFGDLPKKDTPMTDGDHPETDVSAPLSDGQHTQYQMLIGMLNWIVCLGRLDIAFATSSLSRFTACPRKGHLERVLRIFGYLRKYKNKRIIVDSRDPILVGGKDAIDLDFTEIFREQYPDAVEEIDKNIPKPLIDEIEITAFVDSDHAHDKVTRRSITGLLILLGRTPVYFMSKRQGAIETSTYGAEFCAMRTAVEEVQSVRYMLRCLGVRVRYASFILGDNKGVIQNCSISDSLLKKKHVAIAYHKTRESAAAGIVHPIKIDGNNNFADILTKAVTGRTFWRLYGKLTRG